MRAAGVVLLVLSALLPAIPARADGGRLRFREPAGPFIVTLFTTPDPLTKGRADFSVAVERGDAQGMVQNADVTLVLTAGHGQRLVLHPSHAAATSKWLQAANFVLPASGLWQVTVLVRSGDSAGQCSGEFRVNPAGTPNLLWDLLPVPLAGLLLLIHAARKRRYARDRAARLRTAG